MGHGEGAYLQALLVDEDISSGQVAMNELLRAEVRLRGRPDDALMS